MNTSSRSSFPRATVALWLALAQAVLAQDTPPAAQKSTPPPAPTAETPPAPTDPTPAVEAEKAPAEKKGGLRRIDVPSSGSSGASTRRTGNRNRNSHGGEFPIGDHFVPKGSDIHDAVSVFGSTTVEGEVHHDAVSVFGDTSIGPDAKIGGSAVSVLGRLTVEGEVRDEAVSVLGGATVNGKVGGEVVSVLGNLHLGPKAEIGGDIVVVGGKLTKHPSAIVHGNERNVPVIGGFGNIEWLVAWVKQCVLKGRLLAFGPNLGWAWGIAFSFFAFYLLLALLFGRGIEKCAVTLETRPGAAILSSVLTVLLSPIVTILLAVTVVGALLVPFVGAGLFFAGLFGKAVMLAWIGRRFTKFFGDGPLSHPVFAVLIGGLIVMLLYTVWGSFLIYKLLSWLGLGVVVLTIAQSMKREKAPAPAMAAAGVADTTTAMSMPPEVPVAPTEPASAPVTVPTMSSGFTGGSGDTGLGAAASGFVAGGLGESASPAPGPIPVPPAPSMPPVAPLPPPVAPMPPPMRAFAPRVPMVSAVTLPRAGFFPRLAAMALDGVLIGMLVGFTSNLLPRFLQFNHGPGGVLLALAIYAAVMWKNKGTTIGGIVCGLKVVRVDDREIDWATAIVRALGCFLSLAVAGLGFIWVAFDDEKQSWHDKIAGTTVVRVPKGVSLL
jgi:uncharacterized RDD family membrane protein YckC